MDYPVSRNPNIYDYPHFDPITEPSLLPAEFQLSDYLILDGVDDGFGAGDDSSSQSTMMSSEQFTSGASNGYNCEGGATSTDTRTNNKWRKEVKKEKLEVVHKVAFRTKSELEIMDDGFKWRKYGKKSVKNSPNPRNYYKCSSGGCNVKKRVERDREDSKYVITTYEGIHNHESPCVLSYNNNNHPVNMEPIINNVSWTSSPSSSS